MPAPKGHTKAGGRKKGTPNKVTQPLKLWLSEVINANREQIEADLQALEPQQRLHYLERLMQYVIPKQQAVSAQIDYDRLTDADLNEIVDRLTDGLTDNYDYDNN